MSLAKAIVETHYPHHTTAVNTTLPESERFPDEIWLSLAPHTESPTKPTFLLVRDPIERFLSAVAMLQISLASAIEQLKHPDIHMAPQSEYVTKNAHTYKFPGSLPLFCAATQLPYPLPCLNRAIHPKPLLNASQRDTLSSFFSKDIQLYKRAN